MSSAALQLLDHQIDVSCMQNVIEIVNLLLFLVATVHLYACAGATNQVR